MLQNERKETSAPLSSTYKRIRNNDIATLIDGKHVEKKTTVTLADDLFT
jgi:hypothetical protein